MKTYAAKSSVARWAKKELGADWKETGTVEQDAEGKFYYKANVVKSSDGDLKGKSSIDSPCRVVWDIAEEMEGARRKDILAACVEAGIAFYTARTQYQKYREAMKEAAASQVQVAA